MTTEPPTNLQRAAALDLIAVRTRHGQEVHLARAGGSSTRCGVILRQHAQRMRVDSEPTCAKCLAALERAEAGAGELQELKAKLRAERYA